MSVIDFLIIAFLFFFNTDCEDPENMKCSFCLLEKMTYSHVFKNVTFQNKRNAQVKIKSVMYLLSKDPHRIFDFLLPRV